MEHQGETMDLKLEKSTPSPFQNPVAHYLSKLREDFDNHDKQGDRRYFELIQKLETLITRLKELEEKVGITYPSPK